MYCPDYESPTVLYYACQPQGPNCEAFSSFNPSCLFNKWWFIAFLASLATLEKVHLSHWFGHWNFIPWAKGITLNSKARSALEHRKKLSLILAGFLCDVILKKNLGSCGKLQGLRKLRVTPVWLIEKKNLAPEQLSGLGSHSRKWMDHLSVSDKDLGPQREH